MKNEIDTIREALAQAKQNTTHGQIAWNCKEALTALAQIEEAVGSQEPVAEVTRLDGYKRIVGLRNWNRLDHGTKLYASPVAQQPRCPLCNYQYGHQIGCKNNPVDIALKARATQQPQAEAVPHEFKEWFGGGETSRPYCAQCGKTRKEHQAEAEPPTHVLVPVSLLKDSRWRIANLVGSDGAKGADRKVLDALDAVIDAAIAQQNAASKS